MGAISSLTTTYNEHEKDISPAIRGTRTMVHAGAANGARERPIRRSSPHQGKYSVHVYMRGS